MRTSRINNVIDLLRRAVRPDGAVLDDVQLLDCFLQSHDEDAFASLVGRHGPMVWGVCRRLLHPHDAEDAFQATFLVLARKAGSIRSKATMGNWLYGVAHQTALQARRTIARRKAREVQVTTMPDTAAVAVEPATDLHPLLDEALSYLPDIYRVVIVLCELEGLTRKEVAGRLGVPEGTVAGRLARARALLAKRLAQRGVTFSGSVAALFSAGSASSAPPALITSTIKAACLLAAGHATGVASAKIVALAEGVVKTMLLTKLKAALSIALVLGIMATGANFLTYRPATGQEQKKPILEKQGEPAVKPQQEQLKETVTAWGKEVSGLQAGLGYLAGEKRIYHPGETATLVIRVRNVSNEEKKFQYLHQFFTEIPPTITDPQGNLVRLWAVTTFGRHIPIDVTLAPGKEVELHRWKAEIQAASEKDAEKQNFSTLFGPGKFLVHYDKVIGNSSSGILNNQVPNLSDLATGKLDLQVKEADDKKPQEEKDPGKPQAVFTIKNVTIDQVDEKAASISVTLGSGEKRTKLVNLPIDAGTRVVASHVFPTIMNHFPLSWDQLKRLEGKVVSLRLHGKENGFLVESIAAGND